MRMDVKQRIRDLMNEKDWSEYRLAIQCGLSQSTIANIFNRNTTPSISTIESICSGFGINLSQFFAEGPFVELTEEQRAMFDKWAKLDCSQKNVLNALIDVMIKQK